MAFVDIETTGGSAQNDRVTEVAVVSYADGVVQRWSQLLDPGRPIPSMIERLTGINNRMVRGQPVFSDIAPDLAERLQGQIFVAHNAGFDHGFLRAEFARVGVDFAPRVLCTVKLSRHFFAAQARHNLDTLIAVHGLHMAQRHRALADADALLQFWQLLERSRSSAELTAALKALVKPR